MNRAAPDAAGRRAALVAAAVACVSCASGQGALRLPALGSRATAVFSVPEGYRPYSDGLFETLVTCVERNSGTRAAVCLTYSRCIGCFVAPPADAKKLRGTVLGEAIEWSVFDQNGLTTARAEMLPRIRDLLCGPLTAAYLDLVASSEDDLPALQKISESLRFERGNPPCP